MLYSSESPPSYFLYTAIPVTLSGIAPTISEGIEIDNLIYSYTLFAVEGLNVLGTEFAVKGDSYISSYSYANL